MHLRNIEIFCDVAAKRSFSKGAEAHSVAQSSASQTVHMLEERLGTRLIDRSKRPLELTPAGEIYYNGCRKLLESVRRLEDRRLRAAALEVLSVPTRTAPTAGCGRDSPTPRFTCAWRLVRYLDRRDPAQHPDIFHTALTDPNPEIVKLARRRSEGRGVGMPSW